MNRWIEERIIKVLYVTADCLLTVAVLCFIGLILFSLGGCAQLREDLRRPSPGLPCAPGTCTIEDVLEQSRDPFPAEPITASSAMGRPQDGPVTVEPK